MKRPWHLWVIGLLSLVWNAGGAVDYTMSQFHNQAYLAQLPPEMMAFLDTAPVWFDAAWAFGVWGSILGSVLILFGSRHAVSALAVSLAGLVVTMIYSWRIAEPSMIAMGGTGTVLFSLAILAVLIGLMLYARAMVARGHLR
jgi:hypothetical protein